MSHEPDSDQENNDLSDADFDPLDIYSLEDFIAEEEILDEIGRQVGEKLKAQINEEYLRPPKPEELEKILQQNEACGFPDMIGSIDCMHWRWKNCPKAWAGFFTRGDKGCPTMILEAVASRDRRIWHAFFGTAGSQNDINILNKSPLFINRLKGEAPRVHYSINGNPYDTPYYLADRIYPEWAVFVKTIHRSQTEEDKLYAKYQ
jgi:hypothetical protein